MTHKITDPEKILYSLGDHLEESIGMFTDIMNAKKSAGIHFNPEFYQLGASKQMLYAFESTLLGPYAYDNGLEIQDVQLSDDALINLFPVVFPIIFFASLDSIDGGNRVKMEPLNKYGLPVQIFVHNKKEAEMLHMLINFYKTYIKDTDK